MAEAANDDMSMAEVRQGLGDVRRAWFRDFDPETPFSIGKLLPNGMTIASYETPSEEFEGRCRSRPNRS
jgi:hypothetical protein